MRLAAFVQFAAVLILSGCTTNGPTIAEELGWRPNLDQPARQLGEVLATTQQQQPMNYTSANLGFVLDAKLYLLFERYVGSLPGGRRQGAFEEQHRWLDERKRATDAAYAEYAGGTYASFNANSAFIECTKRRIAELESRLRQGTGKASDSAT